MNRLARRKGTAARVRWILVFCGVAVASAALLFFASYSVFRSVELQRAESRVQLYQSTLVAALERFQHLPFILAQDPAVIRGAAGIELAALNRRLAEFAALADLEAIYLMDTTGLTIAASNHDAALTFIGQNYGFRPYFKKALEGTRGEFFAIGATTSRPGYFIAEAVTGADGTVLGVVAIKLDLSDLVEAWNAGGETVLVSNADGVVVLASREAWRYRTLAPLTDRQRQEISTERQFGVEPLDTLEWIADGGTAVGVAGENFLHVTSPVPRLDWTLHFLADEARVLERVWFPVVAAAIIVALISALMVYRRAERMRAALETSHAERRQLRAVNTQLADEIKERRATEQRLGEAQTELARAGKLAALGQLAASVTHELGQPLSAMRNYLTAAELETGVAATGLTGDLGRIVTRMENITKQLRFFARPGEEERQPFDLRDVLDGALALVRHDLMAAAIALDVTHPKTSVAVKGNRLRIEQVLVNLLKNAIAAMDDAEVRRMAVAIEVTPAWARLSVTDTGHGLGDRSIEQLQEPFHTTRASGEGMGLGLAISAAIVKEHDGRLRARAGSDGAGARFTIELPLAAVPAPA